MMFILHLLFKLVIAHANTKLNTNIEQMNKMIKETTEEFATSQKQFNAQVKNDLVGKEDLLGKFNELLKEHNKTSFLQHAKQAGIISSMIKKLTEMDEKTFKENMSEEIIQETKNKNYAIIEDSFDLIEKSVKMRHENNKEFAKNTKNLYEFSCETELKAQCFLDASKKLFEKIPEIKNTFKQLSGETIDEISAIVKEKNINDKKPDSTSTVLLIIGCVIGAILFIGVICIFVHFYKNSQTTQDLP